MKIEQVNEIFRTKYPEGEIFQKGTYGCANGSDNTKIAVRFQENGKIYSYVCNSYADLLFKVGFENILYKHDIKNIENEIERLEKLVKDGGCKVFSKFNKYSDERITELKKQIEENKKILENAIIF